MTTATLPLDIRTANRLNAIRFAFARLATEDGVPAFAGADDALAVVTAYNRGHLDHAQARALSLTFIDAAARESFRRMIRANEADED